MNRIKQPTFPRTEIIQQQFSLNSHNGILLILKTLANFGDDTFVGALQKLCNAASSEDEDVCNGTLALEGPVIAASLRDLTLGSKTAQVFCTTLLGLCDNPEVEPYTVPMPPKTITSPLPANVASNGAKPTPFKIAHFSDIHIDPLYVTGSNAVATSYIAPSMTPLSGMPAFRLYTIDPTTFGILDIETYVADMTDPTFQTTGPVWKRSYAAKETFGALLDTPFAADAELTPAFWHNVTVALENDPAAFEAYWARRTRGWNVPECDEACRKGEICQLRAARSQDNGFVPTPGMSFGIRSEDGTRKPAECVDKANIGL
ncbi:Sphingomyelin phosphodiesterase [Colletotrichum sp. SAR 10_66]|nr:Sphingomyelin phosphodiesterase [Colletotrichum sp. SAR 10_75]KAJ5005653.1 Sphingomyelin phosphodiesterase [Colletotrichum sp. SAR 10_66]